MKFEVLNQSHLKRNILIVVVVVLILAAIILTFTRAKYRTTQSIPLVNGTINYSLADLNIVAITVDGEEVNTIPEGNYTLTENSYCTVNGEEDNSITLNYDSSTQTLSVIPFTTKGTKCYLDFERAIEGPINEVIEEIYEDSQSMLAYDDYNNLRYFGENPDNYVYFNCDDYANPTSSTCELWRIIGIFNSDTHGINNTKLVKIIRNESLGNYAWDSTGNYGRNNWNNADLQQMLNGNYLNGTGEFSENGIKNSTSRNMIQSTTWKLAPYNYFTDVPEWPLFYGYANTQQLYKQERENSTYNGNPTSWTGKIALMYPSDFFYATGGDELTSREACLSAQMDDLENDDNYWACFTNSWLHENGVRKWTIATSMTDDTTAFYISGFLSNHDTINEYSVKPTFYLTSSVRITGGEGTEINPYTLAPN